MVLKVILALLAALILNCSSSLTDKGTGTDIGEAKIYGSVKLPGYINGENVTITLRKQDYIPFSVSSQNLQKTFSGKDGSFTMTRISRGYYLVELLNKDSLCAMKRFYISDNDSAVYLGNLILDTLKEFTGKVLTNGAPASGASLLVMGMDNKITLADDGSFSILLPSGEQLFRIITKNEQSINDVLFSDSSSGDTIRAYTTPLTLFDDFENSDGFNNLNILLGGGGWFAYTDKSDGGNSQILPTADPGLVAAIDTTSNACRGGSLHCTFEIDTTFNSHYALIGSDICISKGANSSRSWFDLTKMTTLTFMAKGSGTINVQFTCKPIGNSYTFTVYEIPITLSSGWNKYSINASDIPNALISSASQVIPWSSGNHAVSNINFLAIKNTDLWLDDIIIEGMNPTDFLK